MIGRWRTLLDETNTAVIARLDRAIQYSRDAGDSAEKPRRTGSPGQAGRRQSCFGGRLANPTFFQGDIDVNTVSNLNTAMAMAATGQTKTCQTRAAAGVSVKLSSHGFAIDHP